MVAPCIEIMHNINFANGVHSRVMIFMFWVSQVSGLVKNFNIGIFSDTINVNKCQTLHDGTTY